VTCKRPRADVPRLHAVWQRLETTLTTGAEPRECGVYICNTKNTARGWYRNIELRRVE